MDIIDSFFRFSAISLFLLMAALIARYIPGRQARFLGVWSALSGAAYLVCTNGPLREALGPAAPIVEVFCQTGQIAVWLFSLSQFRDNLKVWPTYILIGLGYFIITRIYWNIYYGDETLVGVTAQIVNAATRFGLIAHMLYVAWEGRRDDLIEARRRFRTIYIYTVSFTVLMITFSETFLTISERNQPGIYLLQAAGFWLLATILVWMSIDLRKHVVFSAVSGERRQEVPVEDPAEKHDLDGIRSLIEGQSLYLEQGLTIAMLAEKAGLPEHRLRRLINKHLGYRNFADFLNHYRITAAQDRLSSVQDRNIPVLTIAMELGYGSLGPFNRAFKERTGQTPTEYRKQRLAES